MLNNATQIISNVPGKHLNPLLLAQSQWNESEGFMIIAYSPQPRDCSSTNSRFYDLFFLRGSHIYECARMNSDLRFQLQLDAALKTFQRFGQEDGTRVFLFAASTDTLIRFRSTFHHEPCLKVQVQGLSVKQIHNLLARTNCERGIIECNEFVNLVPSIDLKDISSPEDIAQYRPPFKRGRILIYDVEGNKGLFREGDGPDASHSATSANDQSSNHPETSAGTLFSAADEKEAEDFTEFITRFLKSTPSVASGQPDAIESPQSSTDDKHVRNITSQPRQPDLFVVTHRADDLPTPIAGTPGSPPIHGRDYGRARKSKRNHSGEHTTRTAAPPPSADHSEFVRLFERLFRCFRQQIFEAFGDKCEKIVADAERKVRILNPEFDLQSLSEETVVITLDLIEHITNEAPFLKRARLRQGALTLVADLYNKQYEILENNRVIDKVEQFYYRLKK